MITFRWPKRWAVVPVLALALLLPGPYRAGYSYRSRPDSYRYHVLVNVGSFDGEEHFGLLEGASSQSCFSLGFGHRLGPHFLGEFEVGAAFRDHEVVAGSLPPGTDDPTLTVGWLSYSFVGRFSVKRVELFAGVGVGSGQADLEDAADDPFAAPELSIASDRGILFHYRAGFDAAVSAKSRLGLEWRKTAFDADLGAFSGGKTDLGGTAVLLKYRYTWGQVFK